MLDNLAGADRVVLCRRGDPIEPTRPPNTERSSRSAGATRVPLLERFGRLLRQYREQLLKSQTEISRELASHHDSGTFSQSLVAQIEKGRIVNVSGELMTLLASVYKAPKERLVAAIIEDKYGIDSTKASLLTTDVLSLDGIAEWEKSLNAEELWIVTPSFVDRMHTGIREALIHRLKGGTKVVFFVPKDQCGERGDFSIYRYALQLHLSASEMANLAYYELDSELRWIASSFVIADPPPLAHMGKTSRTAEGYTIVLRKSEPGAGPEAFAFPISGDELLALTRGIRSWIQDEEKRKGSGKSTFVSNDK
jgi:transcriptional regulator with XRE-family HTH domain